MDLPGHGDAPRLEAATDALAMLVDAATSSLTASLTTSLTVLVGHSLGAIVALAAANRHPNLAAGIVLEDPPGQSGVDNESLAAGIEASGRAVRADRGAYWQRVREDNPKWSGTDVDEAVASVEAADTAGLARAMREVPPWDLPGLVSALSVPVLVIAATTEAGHFRDGGSALSGTDRDRLAGAVPAERFVVLDGGHSLHREHPREVVDLISTFAGSLTSSTGAGR
jgi:pimeloyl-ACP methyl ester carboxylesterase